MPFAVLLMVRLAGDRLSYRNKLTLGNGVRFTDSLDDTSASALTWCEH